VVEIGFIDGAAGLPAVDRLAPVELPPVEAPPTGSGVFGLLDETPIDNFVGNWFVLHTRSRNEKAVADDLERMKVQHFLPLLRKPRAYAGRVRRVVDLPLFPGYLFVCGDRDARDAAMRTNRIAHVLDVPDQEGLRNDLRQVWRVVNGDEPIELYPRIRRGARCRVRGGSLSGLEGVVVRRQGPWRVYVGVDFVGQSAELEIDPELLELLD
jgi:transcription antitermination factor NusG